MLFNSYEFALIFLPLVLSVFFVLGSWQTLAAMVWLTAASFFFYAYWNPPYLVLLLLSIFFNYLMGAWLRQLARSGHARVRLALALGIGCNLALLAYYKYATFLIANVGLAIGRALAIDTIILPLAISFYTFTQITYLVDAARGRTPSYTFLEYALFVSFFPHLIAGPIVHHWQLLPQFQNRNWFAFDHDKMAAGITLFVMGLGKKVIFADSVAPFASPVFDAAAAGAALTFVEAWGGVLAYTLQLYFDFSGYSDMAIGLALMFGVRFPVNFDSPYKAVNIVEFWRRWHITLSHFLRDYLYVSLGGNRRGAARRYVNLFITMLLGGLWHGAGWTFVIWGALHGAYLIINHGWHQIRRALGFPPREPTWWGRALGVSVTLIAVIVGWVFFRAPTLDAAFKVLTGMAGLNGIVLPASYEPRLAALGPLLNAVGGGFGNLTYFEGVTQLAWTVGLFTVALFAPNSQQIMRYSTSELQKDLPASGGAQGLVWRPDARWAVVTGVSFIFALTQMSKISEFLYFQF
jgi:D-alanyl-lipoteichoic acid acyltransferase DltB (MBOAT superfamily)